MIRLFPSRQEFVLLSLLVALGFLNACASTTDATFATIPPKRAACAPRPTRTPDPYPTETRDPFPKSPTTAPSPTAGPPPPVHTDVRPTLKQALNTKELVLKKLLEFEIQGGQEWDAPWCLETLRLDPERISMERYETVNAAESTMGGWRYDGDGEPAWVVTIQGETMMYGPGIGGEQVNWVRYIIGEKTGTIYGEGGGRNLPPPTLGTPQTPTPRKTRVPRTRKPRTPSATPTR